MRSRRRGGCGSSNGCRAADAHVCRGVAPRASNEGVCRVALRLFRRVLRAFALLLCVIDGLYTTPVKRERTQNHMCPPTCSSADGAHAVKTGVGVDFCAVDLFRTNICARVDVSTGARLAGNPGSGAQTSAVSLLVLRTSISLMMCPVTMPRLRRRCAGASK